MTAEQVVKTMLMKQMNDSGNLEIGPHATSIVK